MTAVQEARHEDFVDPHLEGIVGEALDDLEGRIPGSVSSAEELVHKAKEVLSSVEKEADADTAHISPETTDRLTSFVDQGVYRWILDPAGRADAQAVEAAKTPDDLTGTARTNFLKYLGDSDKPREAFAMYRIRYQQLAQLSDALLEKYPEDATTLPLD